MKKLTKGTGLKARFTSAQWQSAASPWVTVTVMVTGYVNGVFMKR